MTSGDLSLCGSISKWFEAYGENVVVEAFFVMGTIANCVGMVCTGHTHESLRFGIVTER
jgi:hypothetical protein